MKKFLLVCGKYAPAVFAGFLILDRWGLDTWQYWVLIIASGTILTISEECQNYLRRIKK